MIPILLFASIFIGLETCVGQYNQGYSYQNYNNNPHYGRTPHRKQDVRRIHPNDLYPGITRRVHPEGQVRQKQHHGRVHPDDYVRTKTHVRPVYHKKQPVRRTHYKQPAQQYQTYQQYQQYQQSHYKQQYQPYYQKTPQRNQVVYQKRQHEVYQPNYYKPKWPKLRGRCQSVPDFKINGVNPVIEQCKQGRVVVLFLMKRRCNFCYHQLAELNKLAEHYFRTGKPLSVIAINHKRGRLSRSTILKYPYVQIYEEPQNMYIFERLRVLYRNIIIYDVCCRKQYLFGYPYSWMGYSFVKMAIFNSLYYDQLLCGVCDPGTQPPNVTMASTPKTSGPVTTLPVATTAAGDAGGN